MNNDKKKKNMKIYKVGQMMGLNKKDMNSILNDISSRIEHPSLTTGPDPYIGAFYGTISIKYFQYYG